MAMPHKKKDSENYNLISKQIFEMLKREKEEGKKKKSIKRETLCVVSVLFFGD